MRQTGSDISNRKSALIFAVAALVAVACANVAHACPPGDEGGRHMQRMADALKLNDQQQQQFQQLHAESRSAGQAIHDAMRMNREAMRKLDPGAKDYRVQVARLADEKAELVRQMVMQHSEVRAQTYALLTPTQREKAAAMQEKRADGRRGHGGRDGDRCGGDRRVR